MTVRITHFSVTPDRNQYEARLPMLGDATWRRPSESGTQRRLAALQKFGCDRSKADIPPASQAARSVENDPKRTLIAATDQDKSRRLTTCPLLTHSGHERGAFGLPSPLVPGGDARAGRAERGQPSIFDALAALSPGQEFSRISRDALPGLNSRS